MDIRYEEESQKLDTVISRIAEILNKNEALLSVPKEAAYATGEAAREFRKQLEVNSKNLTLAKSNPYFGRVDFIDESDPTTKHTYYFGKYRIPIDHVYSWEARASRLFYMKAPDVSYATELGEIVSGKVELNREIAIEDSKLISVTDFLPVSEDRKKIGSAVLTRELSKPKGKSSRNIVDTIQPEQYEKIAATTQAVMVIQGVAGSGKSQIGLHRIAFLLSPNNELNLDIKPNRVLYLGPSKQFLKYVVNLLPGLGVERVKQTTVSDWLRSLYPNIKIRAIDETLNRELSGIASINEIGVAKFKCSLQIAKLLDQSLKDNYNKIYEGFGNLSSKGRLVMKSNRIRQIIKGAAKNPFNILRKNVWVQINTELLDNLRLRQNDIDEVKTQFDEFWPELDVEKHLFTLLSNRNLLTSSQVKTSTIKTKRFIDKQDLPALCYLNLLANGIYRTSKTNASVSTYDHIVVDEAQDISPLEFLILYNYSRNKSFTILGDIGQAVLPHTGLLDWRDIKPIFSKEGISLTTIRVAYRATNQLTKFSNAILKRISSKIRLAIPYNRQGEKPKFIRSKSYKGMMLSIKDDVETLLESPENMTIAILTKTTIEARRIQKWLQKNNIQSSMLDRKYSIDTRIVVGSIINAKGLEFDAVIIPNARENNYPDNKLFDRLLYIAVTRSAKILHIHWFGDITAGLKVFGFFKEPKLGKNLGKLKINPPKKSGAPNVTSLTESPPAGTFETFPGYVNNIE